MRAEVNLPSLGRMLGLALALIWLTGCASLPQELQLPEEQVLVGYGKVIQAPEKHVGQMVRWGGVIAKVRNKSDHSIVEVAYYPISSSGRPRVDERHSSGRFRAKIPGLADPMVYKKGKAITFVGPLGKPIESKIDEFTYKFPLVLAQQHVLWKDLPEYDDRYYYGWPHHHRYPYPYYRPYRWYDDPWHHSRPSKPHRSKTKKVKKPAKVIHD